MDVRDQIRDGRHTNINVIISETFSQAMAHTRANNRADMFIDRAEEKNRECVALVIANRKLISDTFMSTFLFGPIIELIIDRFLSLSLCLM